MGKLGFWVIELDIIHNFDLTLERNISLVQGLIFGKKFKYVHIGTPCSSWSRCRDRPNGPPRMRNDQEGIWGLQDLRDCDRVAVARGNRLLRVSVRLAKAAERAGVAGSIENPVGSRIFVTKPVCAFVALRSVRSLTLDYCAFGMAWRKRTRILYWHCDLSALEIRCASRGGWCDFSGCKHKTLEGRDPVSGCFWSHIAEPYPNTLVKKWSRCVRNSIARREYSVLSFALT